MAESLTDFFSDEYIITSDFRNEAALIHDYLAGNDQAQNVALRVFQSLQNLNGKELKYSFYDVMENAVVCVAEQLPETHDALVVLLDAFKNQQSETRDFDIDLAGGLWFALDERRLRYGDPDISLNMREEYRNDWTNLNHFAALIHKADLQNLETFAVATLCMALRRQGWRVKWKGTNTSDSMGALEGHAPAAASWIIVCGQKLYSECSEAREKWSKWKADLEWIVEQSGLTDETMSICEEALTDMQRIA